jgi:hypothetical protein
MIPINLLSLLRPPTATILDLRGVQWESWLAQIRTEAIISNVWQYIDPAILDNQILPLLAPPPAIPPHFDISRLFVAENDDRDDNNNKAAKEWIIAALIHDRTRDWKIYDEKMDSLRVIRAFILWTAPVQWTTYDGVVGGGPFASVRSLLVFLSSRIEWLGQIGNSGSSDSSSSRCSLMVVVVVVMWR